MLASSNPRELAALIEGYRLCATAEGKSPKTVAIVTRSVSYLEHFLSSAGLPTNTDLVGTSEIRNFIVHLQQVRRFSAHAFTKPQEEGLSRHTINCYLRSIRAFWSWLISEEVIDANPFARVKIPKAPVKVVPTFSPTQLRSLLQATDTSTPEGVRDHAIILTLLDTGLRLSELTSARLEDLSLEDGLVKVMGKGGKERVVPLGREVRRMLWRYVKLARPAPGGPGQDRLFLTHDGRPLTKNRVEAIIQKLGRKAGLQGVRCSPHTFRHTAAVSFLRNGGDVFSLQRLLGHSSLEMTRHYCQLADVDVKRAHATASPVDNLIHPQAG